MAYNGSAHRWDFQIQSRVEGCTFCILFFHRQHKPDLHWNRQGGLICTEFSARNRAVAALPWERGSFPQGKAAATQMGLLRYRPLLQVEQLCQNHMPPPAPYPPRNTLHSQKCPFCLLPTLPKPLHWPGMAGAIHPVLPFLRYHGKVQGNLRTSMHQLFTSMNIHVTCEFLRTVTFY